MSVKTLNKGGRIARASVVAKLRRLKKKTVKGGAAQSMLDELITWVNFSASRYGKRPGGLGGRSR